MYLMEKNLKYKESDVTKPLNVWDVKVISEKKSSNHVVNI